MMALLLRCVVETGSPSNCAGAQMHSPIALGDHLTERSAADAYRMMLTALDYCCLYHWYNDMTVIPTHPTLTGHSHPNFSVTGPMMTGGSLIRNTTASSPALDFPIGTSIGSYTPLPIKYTGVPQVIKFRVADNVYNKLNFPEYVNKTWIMNTANADPSGTVELTLQHNAADEGSRYFSSRSEAYVSRYDTRMVGLWDVLPPMATSTPGIITDRAAIFDAYMNTRRNITAIKPIE